MTIAGLDALEERITYELALVEYPLRPWTRPHAHPFGAHVYDVVIVGAGQCGLGVAYGLKREKVENVLVLDENPEGSEGPWLTYARMITLRTPKHLIGMELGLPSLTFRAFWDAQFGPEAWAKLDKIPREDWARYLAWFRRVLALPVRNDTKVTAIERDGDLFNLTSASGEPFLARKVVLATGIQGGGEWHVPSFISEALPRSLYAHTADAIDFNNLRGKSIAILGGGASAFDNAQHALAQGASSVEVFVRRTDLPRINPIRHMEGSGLIAHFALLHDAAKYAAMDHFLRANQPPTNDTFNRAAAHPGFKLHLGAPWTKVAQAGDQARVTTPHGEHVFDFLIVSTGTVIDLSLRPELSAFAPHIALWRDRYRSAPGKENAALDAHPYLGASFEFTGGSEEANKRLHGLFLFNYAALASLGLSGSAISGMKAALPRLISGVTGQLFLDDQDQILREFLAYDDIEFVAKWP